MHMFQHSILLLHLQSHLIQYSLLIAKLQVSSLVKYSLRALFNIVNNSAFIVCTLCDKSVTPSGIDHLSITTEQDGCKKLQVWLFDMFVLFHHYFQCDNGRRIKIGESLAIDGSAECKYEQESVWKFNDKTIKKDSKITCVETS